MTRRGNHLREPTNYLLDAIDVVRENKRLHSEAEVATHGRRRPHRPPYYDQIDGEFDGS